MPYKDKKKQKEALHTHYLNNKCSYKRRAATHSKIARLRNAQYVHDYLKSHPCVDCGESDPMVLQFDHKDDAQKDRAISSAVSAPWSLKRLINEMKKCEVRCANCHLRRTAQQQGWYEGIKWR